MALATLNSTNTATKLAMLSYQPPPGTQPIRIKLVPVYIRSRDLAATAPLKGNAPLCDRGISTSKAEAGDGEILVGGLVSLLSIASNWSVGCLVRSVRAG
jgi:hypothetical protein